MTPEAPVVRLRLNGEERSVPLRPDRSLLYVLRDELGLTGTKYGCGEGECGACDVLLDGAAARACQTRIGEVAGRSVVTIEGLATGSALHPVHAAFLESAAFQCGYCTPGMVVAAVALLSRNPDPSPEEIAAALQGNVCRCGGYPRIVEAVRRAAALGARRGGGRP